MVARRTPERPPRDEAVVHTYMKLTNCMLRHDLVLGGQQRGRQGEQGPREVPEKPPRDESVVHACMKLTKCMLRHDMVLGGQQRGRQGQQGRRSWTLLARAARSRAKRGSAQRMNQ